MQLLISFEKLTGPVYVDRDMWEKMVLNLLSNAFKFTLKGSITVSLRQVGDAVELAVSDTGIGIAPDEQRNVFRRFHRVEGAEGRTHEGSGIGLALVSELAKLHGGSVRVESKLGEGSVFSVQIPLGSAHLAETFRPDVDPSSSSVHRADGFVEEASRWLPENSSISSEPIEEGRNRRVLLVDDNADMRGYVKRLLDVHYQVTAVENGLQALRAARIERPDLILSDVMMPVMDGTELVRQLRADPTLRTVPVILLSARAGEEARASGIELGADDYLTKPFSAKELLARVQTQITMSEVRSQAIAQEVRSEELSRNQLWMESILDRIPTPLFWIDLSDGDIRFSNRAALAIAAGAPALSDFQVEAGSVPLPSRVLAGEAFRDVAMTWRSSNGRLDVVVDAEPLPPMEGRNRCSIVTFRDISRMKQIEQQLKALIGARDEFLSIASHELKTPITSLKMQLEMTERAMKENDGRLPNAQRLEKVLRVSGTQVDRLTGLVNALLDVSRVHAGRLALSVGKGDLAELTREVSDRLALQLKESGCRIILNLPEHVTGTWDMQRLEQVLTNLLINAAKYAPNGPIQISLSAQPDIVRLEVQDAGPGIQAEYRESIFNRFDRGIASRNAGGLGLGLFISRQIVSGHGGTIALEPSSGPGARFVVTLPRETVLTPMSLQTADLRSDLRPLVS
jgi:signal transduction histidine kinase